MKWLGTGTLVSLLLTIPQHTLAIHHKRDYDAHDYYAVHLRSGVSPSDVSTHLGLRYDGPLGELKDHHIFRTLDTRFDHDHIGDAIKDLRQRRKRGDPGSEGAHILDSILLSQKQELHKRFPLVKRNPIPADEPIPEAAARGKEIASQLSISDPIFLEQWHLFNPVQLGHDINVTGVWEQGVTGEGSIVCLVDDGLDMDSEDLRENYYAPGSYDFNDQLPDPKPRLSDDRHGTRCAGEISAVKNNVCGVGVAYGGKVSGARILSGIISDADESIAMNYAYQENHIYSCSWGPPDDGQAMEAPGILIQRAMVNGVQNGRGGLGSIYVFAIGNGAAADDNCNFDGYTNSIYSVSVGAIDRKGLHPYYSEKCSAQLVVTYSSGSGDAIHTTDVGLDKCATSHGGTSAAGPLVSGIYALMLEVNPRLTWRDIQYITVMTAVRIDQGDDWAMNQAIGREFSHQYGYGKADAYAMVEAARTWKTVKPQAWFYSPWLHVKHEVPQGDQGLASSFDVTRDMLKAANLERLEHVTVTMNVQHTRRGDLSVELRSPSGMVSHIATTRRNDNEPEGYIDWTFMSVAHWGESGIGTWTVIVKDTNVNDNKGTFTDWRLRLWGEAIDGTNQPLIPLPNESDDDDHDVYHTPVIGTTSVSVPTETGAPAGNPDDHIDRPVKPSSAPAAVSTPSAPPSSASTTAATATATAMPSPDIPTPTHDDNKEEEVQRPSSTASSDANFLPRPFPTFGVSKKTQIWIYGAFVLILLFLAGLGAWWYYIRRKKRKWMARDDYGFEMVDHDDDDDADLDGGDDGGHGAANGSARRDGAGGARRKRGGRRAGELYDAFAEGSEDEADVFDVGSDLSDDEDAREDSRLHGRGQTRGEQHYDEKSGRYRDDDPLKEGTDV